MFQLLASVMYLVVIAVTSKGAYRIFSQHRPARFFDPIKISLWFVGLALLYNTWVYSPLDTISVAVTLLVATTLGALCLAVFRTESAIYDSGEP